MRNPTRAMINRAIVCRRLDVLDGNSFRILRVQIVLGWETLASGPKRRGGQPLGRGPFLRVDRLGLFGHIQAGHQFGFAVRPRPGDPHADGQAPGRRVRASPVARRTTARCGSPDCGVCFASSSTRAEGPLIARPSPRCGESQRRPASPRRTTAAAPRVCTTRRRRRRRTNVSRKPAISGVGGVSPSSPRASSRSRSSTELNNSSSGMSSSGMANSQITRCLRALSEGQFTLREHLLQRGNRLVQAAFHGSNRAARRLGDLFVGQPLGISQDDGLALRFR